MESSKDLSSLYPQQSTSVHNTFPNNICIYNRRKALQAPILTDFHFSINTKYKMLSKNLNKILLLNKHNVLQDEIK